MPVDKNPNAESNGGTVSARLHHAVDGAADRMSSIKDGARDRGAALLKDLGGAMSRHPIATVAIGLGAGYLLARLRARR
jgi:ElaB/YqjD/DUF883 family membrane-anchored ribosome-binding protein